MGGVKEEEIIMSHEALTKAQATPEVSWMQEHRTAMAAFALTATLAGVGAASLNEAEASAGHRQVHTTTAYDGMEKTVTRTVVNGDHKTVTKTTTAVPNVQDGRWRILGGEPEFPGGAHTKHQYEKDVLAHRNQVLLHRYGFDRKEIHAIDKQTRQGKGIHERRVHFGDAFLRSTFGTDPVREDDVTITADETKGAGVPAWFQKVTVPMKLGKQLKHDHAVSKTETFEFLTPEKCMNFSLLKKVVKIKYLIPHKGTPSPTPTVTETVTTTPTPTPTVTVTVTPSTTPTPSNTPTYYPTPTPTKSAIPPSDTPTPCGPFELECH
jgi:hypothetical protein